MNSIFVERLLLNYMPKNIVHGSTFTYMNGLFNNYRQYKASLVVSNMSW